MSLHVPFIVLPCEGHRKQSMYLVAGTFICFGAGNFIPESLNMKCVILSFRSHLSEGGHSLMTKGVLGNAFQIGCSLESKNIETSKQIINS